MTFKVGFKVSIYFSENQTSLKLPQLLYDSVIEINSYINSPVLQSARPLAVDSGEAKMRTAS